MSCILFPHTGASFTAVAAFLVAASAVAAGAQNSITEVEIRGELRRVAPSLIRTTLGLCRKGWSLSQENVQEAIRALQGLNVFEDIQMWGQETPEGVKVIVVVTEYPALEGIRFKGHKELKEKEMKEALGLVIGQVTAPRDIAPGASENPRDVQGQGVSHAPRWRGRSSRRTRRGKSTSSTTSTKGRKVRIKTITFTGNEALGDGKLKKQMETKENRWWRKGEFKPEVFDEDKQKLVAYYRSEEGTSRRTS